jgi:hypothetical protein
MRHFHVAPPTTESLVDAAILAEFPRDGDGLMILHNSIREGWLLELLEGAEDELTPADADSMRLLRFRGSSTPQIISWFGPPKTALQRRIVRSLERARVERIRRTRTRAPAQDASPRRHARIENRPARRARAAASSNAQRGSPRSTDDPEPEPPLTPAERSQLRNLIARARLAAGGVFDFSTVDAQQRRCPRCKAHLPTDAFTGRYCRRCKAGHERDRRGKNQAVAA